MCTVSNSLHLLHCTTPHQLHSTITTLSGRCLTATVADQYYNYPFQQAAPASDDEDEQEVPASGAQYQQLLAQSFQTAGPYIGGQAQQAYQSYQQSRGALSPQSTTPQQMPYSMSAQPMVPSQFARGASQVASSQHSSPYRSPPVPTQYQQYAQPTLKRVRTNEYGQQVQSQPQATYQMPASGQYATASGPEFYGTAMRQPQPLAYQLQGQQVSPQSSAYSQQQVPQQQAPQQHHHHRLPTSSRQQRPGGQSSSSAPDHGPPSVVGQPGMPSPAPRPRGPKLKFTPEDDALLIELKETKNLTWKQIADFFPGRSSGTLQVRYCTKLKPKAAAWTDEMVQKLRKAIRDYENDRWRIISNKVGNGFSATACREKATDFEAENDTMPLHHLGLVHSAA